MFCEAFYIWPPLLTSQKMAENIKYWTQQVSEESLPWSSQSANWLPKCTETLALMSYDCGSDWDTLVCPGNQKSAKNQMAWVHLLPKGWTQASFPDHSAIEEAEFV